MRMLSKPYWQSKTLWLNTVTALVMVLTAADVLAVLPRDRLADVAAIVAVLNIVIRVFFTTGPVRR